MDLEQEAHIHELKAGSRGVREISRQVGCLAEQWGEPKAHRKRPPHRFRGTFSVESMLAGVPPEQVSSLRGHQSVKINERQYAPWTRPRQEQLEASVRRSWVVDPVFSREGKGTRAAHGRTERVN